MMTASVWIAPSISADSIESDNPLSSLGALAATYEIIESLTFLYITTTKEMSRRFALFRCLCQVSHCGRIRR